MAEADGSWRDVAVARGRGVDPIGGRVMKTHIRFHCPCGAQREWWHDCAVFYGETTPQDAPHAMESDEQAESAPQDQDGARKPLEPRWACHYCRATWEDAPTPRTCPICGSDRIDANG